MQDIKARKDEVYLFEGYINIPQDGDYTFSLKSSGRSFLKIHGANVIDADYGFEAGTAQEGSVKLAKGYHPIKIYYSFDSKSSNLLELNWESSTFSKSSIPENVFFTQ